MLAPNLLLDGDECVMAIMARLTLEGKDFSLFFWGQQYGMSIFEVFACIPYFLLFGYTTLTAKLGALTVWTIGTLFLYKAIEAVTKSEERAFWVTLLFILFPAWIVWSMKLCGGYTSAFLFSNILIYILFDEKRRHNTLHFISIGVLLALIYECQRLWLAGTLPFVIYSVWQEKRRINVLYILLSAVLLCGGLWFYKQGIAVTHVSSNSRLTSNYLLWYLTRFPAYLNKSLQGNYYFNSYQGPWFFNGLLAYLGSGLFFCLPVLAVIRMFSSVKKHLLFIVSTLFIPLVYAYSFLTYTEEGRYMLPLSGFLAIAVAIAMPSYKRNTVIKIGYGLLAGCGIVSCICFYNFFEVSRTYKDNVLSSIKFLKEQNVHYTYNTDCMMPFQIMYYSDMKILSRMPYQPARYQPHSNAVDAAMNRGDKIAVVVLNDVLLGMSFPYQFQSEHISVCINPPVYEIYKGYDFYHGQ